MSLLSLATSPIWSSVLGGLGGIITGVLQLIQKRDEAKLKMAEWAHNIELAKMQANVDAAKLAGLMALTREKGAADAYTASIESDAKVRGESRRFTNLRVSVRPVLTYVFQLVFFIILGLAMVAWWRGWCADYQIIPFIEYMVVACVNAANMTLSWWFGQRQIERSSISWGNSVAGASVKSEVNKTSGIRS